MTICNFKTLLTVAAVVASVATPVLAEEFIPIRFAEPRPIIDFRSPEGSNGRFLMTLEELREWNPRFSDADDRTMVPAMVPILFKSEVSIMWSGFKSP